MSLREELLEFFNTTDTESSAEISTREVLKIFEKRIDELIEIDNQTITRKSYKVYDEGRISAIASKNTLILVKEMLK